MQKASQLSNSYSLRFAELTHMLYLIATSSIAPGKVQSIKGYASPLRTADMKLIQWVVLSHANDQFINCHEFHYVVPMGTLPGHIKLLDHA